jgi:DNA-binding response OmpR family regulator
VEVSIRRGQETGLAVKRILVVEVDDNIRTALHAMLSEYGCEVTLAGDVGNALFIIGVTKPDVILADADLGPDAIQMLIRSVQRSWPTTGPEIVLTSTSNKVAIPGGVAKLLTKPFDWDELEALVKC